MSRNHGYKNMHFSTILISILYALEPYIYLYELRTEQVDTDLIGLI